VSDSARKNTCRAGPQEPGRSGNAEIRSPPRPAPQGPARAAGGEEEAQGQGEVSACTPASTLRWGPP
jgi:hypothetical protein